MCVYEWSYTFQSANSWEGFLRNVINILDSFDFLPSLCAWMETSAWVCSLLREPVIMNSVLATFRLSLLALIHVKSRLSLIVRVNVDLNRTVVDSDWCFDNLCGSHLRGPCELYHVSWWYYTLVIDLIGLLRRDVIGRLSLKPWFLLAIKTRNVIGA